MKRLGLFFIQFLFISSIIPESRTIPAITIKNETSFELEVLSGYAKPQESPREITVQAKKETISVNGFLHVPIFRYKDIDPQQEETKPIIISPQKPNNPIIEKRRRIKAFKNILKRSGDKQITGSPSTPNVSSLYQLKDPRVSLSLNDLAALARELTVFYLLVLEIRTPTNNAEPVILCFNTNKFYDTFPTYNLEKNVKHVSFYQFLFEPLRISTTSSVNPETVCIIRNNKLHASSQEGMPFPKETYLVAYIKNKG